MSATTNSITFTPNATDIDNEGLLSEECAVAVLLISQTITEDDYQATTCGSPFTESNLVAASSYNLYVQGTTRNGETGVYDEINTVTSSVSTLNTAPVGENITFDAGAGDIVNGTLIGSDADGDSLTFQIVSQPQRGAFNAFDSSTGAFQYEVTDGTGFFGTDSFTYQLTDDNGGLSAAYTVTMNNIVDF